ncbi:MAG: FAD-dependent oxidoreductase [Actinomycetia bacterium]|nr:FAD-dependent oxidoreductase [Actinomycetes bacterium]
MVHSNNSTPVAVIGSGVAGLTAAYLLQRRYAVTLYEASERLGGHAHTHDVALRAGASTPVDTGFIVHNRATYPNLVRLFDELGVETRPTEMSMSIRCFGCGLEYAGGRGLSGVFGEPRQTLRPRFLRMLAEVRRFHRAARSVLAGSDDSRTLRAFLDALGFSTYFVDHFVAPLVSTVWSTGTQDALTYPAAYLFRFLDNHGMLSVSGSHQWRTVAGGSRTYVERAAKRLSAVRTGCPIRSVQRHADGADVRADAGETHTFAHVVIATHADQALAMLTDPSPAERDTLGAFRFTTNDVVLHRDTRLLPRSARTRASWNYVANTCGSPGATGARVTYDMSRLQHLGEGTHEPLLVSLGQSDRVRHDRVLKRFSYTHPVYTPESVAAQEKLPALADGRVQFAGAWQGWGFHEDGCVSGIRAARALGVTW